MKRDFDVMRKLLLDATNSTSNVLMLREPFNGAPAQTVQDYEHARLLCDAGLFEALGKNGFRITNSGHDFAAAIQDDEIWKDAKENAGHLTLDDLVEEALGLFRQSGQH